MTLRPGRSSSILAVVTHYQCERWLPQCLESIVGQTRPADAVVVIDDASSQPPVEIVERFPGVALLVAAQNVGMYRLLQQIVDETHFDAYFFQDADDWSTPDRLAVLLDEAERADAEMVGCQANEVFEGIPPEPPVAYPRDVNAAAMASPAAHPILLSSAIASRDLIQRLGGFATGLRYGADTEFIHRAVFAGTIVNAPEHCYNRRIHPDAATRRPDTGYKSPLRNAIRLQLLERSQSNHARASAGEPPDLRPISVAEPIVLTHRAGRVLMDG